MESWDDDIESEGCYSADSLAAMDKYFSDIYTEDQIFSNHMVEVSEGHFSQDYRDTSSSEASCNPAYDYERFFRMEYPNRRVSVTKHSTRTFGFVSELPDIDVAVPHLVIYPYGSIAVLENGPELLKATERLRQEALSNLKFLLLTKSYKLTTDMVKTVVDKHADILAAKLSSMYSGKIHGTTVNLLHAIVCDTYDSNDVMQDDIEVAERQFHERLFSPTGDSSSQVEHDMSTKQKIEIATAPNIGERAVEETMETFYQHFQTVEDKKKLKAFMNINFIGSEDMTVAKTILKDEATWDHDFRVRELTLCGIIWKTEKPIKHSKQRALLLLLGRMRAYRRMGIYLYLHAPKYGYFEEEARGNKGWRFTMRIHTYYGNSTPDEGESKLLIRIFYTRKKRLKRMTKLRPRVTFNY